MYFLAFKDYLFKVFINKIATQNPAHAMEVFNFFILIIPISRGNWPIFSNIWLKVPPKGY